MAHFPNLDSHPMIPPPRDFIRRPGPESHVVAMGVAALLSLGVIAYIFAHPDALEAFADTTFFLEATRLQLDTISSAGEIDGISLVLADAKGTEYQNMSGWTEEEQARIEASMEAARAFVEERMGPPVPWVADNVLVVFNAQGTLVPELENTSMAYSSYNMLLSNVRVLRIVDTTQLDDVGLFAHEYEHARTDGLRDWPLSWIEGMGREQQVSYYNLHPTDGSAPDGTKPILAPDDFARINLPYLATTPFSEMDEQQRMVFYEVAAEGWHRLLLTHPNVAKEITAYQIIFEKEHKRPPSFREIEVWLSARYVEYDQIKNGENGDGGNYAWQNPSYTR